MTNNSLSLCVFDISIIHKTYKFYLILYGYVKRLPKFERYSIGQKSCDLTLTILELLLVTEARKKNDITDKLKLLKSVDIKIKTLQILIRMKFDTKIINQTKYILLQNKLQEIGKMSGGWIKYLKRQTPHG